jgi:hypothetical protein
VPPPTPSSPPSLIESWSKTLSASDAQRKTAGHQRGAVTLVLGDRRGQIDQRTFFRNELFHGAEWSSTTTATGLPMDKATISMDTVVSGEAMGILEFEVTYAANRESKQHNYRSLLHVSPLTRVFQEQDVTGRKLEIEALSDGTYRLTIS